MSNNFGFFCDPFFRPLFPSFLRQKADIHRSNSLYMYVLILAQAKSSYFKLQFTHGFNILHNGKYRLALEVWVSDKLPLNFKTMQITSINLQNSIYYACKPSTKVNPFIFGI